MLDMIKTPEELSKWMKNNIKYKNFDKLMSSSKVFKEKKGSCHDQVQLERYWFVKNNIKNGRLFLIEHNNDNNPGGRTHTLLYFIKNNNYYWFENAWGGEEGIHGPYKDLNSLKDEVKSKMLKGSKYKYVEFGNVNNIKVGMTLQQYVDACLK